MLKRPFIKYVLFLTILHIKICQCLRLYKLSNISENEVMPKLEDILRNDGNTGYRTNGLYFKEKPYNDLRRHQPINQLGRNFLGKSTLVSRIIPHGYRSNHYEYDSKLNTIYKPLIRFHIKKPVKKQKKYTAKAITSTSKVLGYVIVVNKDTDTSSGDTLSQIKHLLTNREDSQLDLNKFLRQREERSPDFLKTLQSPTLKKEMGKLFDKSGESFDSLAPGKIPYVPSSYEDRPKPPPRIIPEYPYWNYWTYSKTIHQDECPGSLVKLGQICIAPSGHRRIN